MSQNVRHLPSVEQVLNLESTAPLLKQYRREYVVGLVRQVLEELRQELRKSGAQAERRDLLEKARAGLDRALESQGRPSLRRAINATGVILHTGLGRAPLPRAALEAMQRVGENYCTLEYDLERGERGERLAHVEGLICQASGAEAALVVNNNAAAVLLMLHTLAQGREVIVSRGQLVEIGGSFRMPEVIAASGARIREVGTTNRTHRRDYEQAIGPETAMILMVHPSNYRVQGFTFQVGLAELVEVSRRAGIVLAYDLGGGVLVDLGEWGLPAEPVVRSCLEQGADLVSFSGDKVLGGPQAGLIAGRRQYVERLAKAPLLRALRCDKLILAALQAALKLFCLAPGELARAHPVLGMMSAPVKVLEERAERLLRQVPARVQRELGMSVVESVAQTGSGALPLVELPSRALTLKAGAQSVEKLARRLRQTEPPVVGRIAQERLLLDMRTVRDDELEAVAQALVEAAKG